MSKPRTNVVAAIIGINKYDSQRVNDLDGCVNDAIAMWQWLTIDQAVPKSQIRLLLAPTKVSALPSTLGYQEPSRKIIIDTFQWLHDTAKDDDIVFIHYSGHGGRLPTVYAKHKVNTALDEGLVPMDWPSEDILRDLQIGSYLQTLTGDYQTPPNSNSIADLFSEHSISQYDGSNGLGGQASVGQQKEKRQVVVVLDCCHSGGAIRGEDPSDEEDSDPEIGDENQREKRGKMRFWGVNLSAEQKDIIQRSVWQQGANNYTVLMACQPNESAWETRRAGKDRGRFTYHLLSLLKSMGDQAFSTTYLTLLHQLRARFTASQYPGQNPMLSGNGDCVFFGPVSNQNQGAAYEGAISAVDPMKTEVSIDIGTAHGVIVGDEYSIHGLKSSATDAPIGTLKVAEAHGLSSKAEIIGGANSSAVRVGCKLSFHTRPLSPQSYVRLISPKDPVPEALKDAVQVLRTKWKVSSVIPKLLVDDEDNTEGLSLAFKIVIETGGTSNGRHVIRDSKGKPLPRIPDLPIGGSDEAEKVVRAILHLTKFELIKSLRNTQSTMTSKLFKFSVTGGGSSAKNGIVRVKHSESIMMSIKNKLPEPPESGHEQHMNALYVHYFNLTQSYEVTAFHTKLSEVSIVEPQREIFVPVKMTGPKDSDPRERAEDVIKLIVTTSSTQFDLLRMGKLEDAINGDDVIRSGDDEGRFKSLLNTVFGWVSLGPPKLTLGDWQTAQTVVFTSRQG